MKYFITADERKKCGDEDYYEFKAPNAKEEFWDDNSLYLSYDVMSSTGLNNFINECMQEDIIFDFDTVQAEDWNKINNKAKELGGEILEVIGELGSWVVPLFERGNKSISVVSDFDRALVKRQKERDEYQKSPEFIKEVDELKKKHLSIGDYQEKYEELLRKYNMPECFFPMKLY